MALMDISHPQGSFSKQLMSDTKNLADFIRNTLSDLDGLDRIAKKQVWRICPV